MTDRLDLPRRYQHMVETLVARACARCRGVGIWHRISGENHEGSDLDLVLRSPTLEPLGTAFTDLVEAFRESNIPSSSKLRLGNAAREFPQRDRAGLCCAAARLTQILTASTECINRVRIRWHLAGLAVNRTACGWTHAG